MNLSSDSPEPPKPSSERIALTIRGVGNIPSFKNRKIAVRDCHRPGKQKNITDPKIKARMQAIEDAIVCALNSACRTGENETPSECSKRLRTVLSGLCDDSVREIPAGEWAVEFVSPGEEGADITIELIP